MQHAFFAFPTFWLRKIFVYRRPDCPRLRAPSFIPIVPTAKIANSLLSKFCGNPEAVTAHNLPPLQA